MHADMYNDSSHSELYAKYRHSYTDQVFQAIADYCRMTTPDLQLAVDVGCGPGMSSIGLTRHFQKVVGVDISPTQIESAPKDIPGLEFKVGCSDKLPFIETGSADLFCAGQAFQYMPREETLAEADRVLRPGGTLAIFGYSEAHADLPTIEAAIREIYKELTPHWPKGTSLANEHKFGKVVLPYGATKGVHDLKIRKTVDLESFMGFLRSLYPFKTICKNSPDRDFDAELQNKMLEAIKEDKGGDNGEPNSFEISWDVFIQMAHKPLQI